MTKLFYIDTEMVAYIGEVMTNRSLTVEETLNSLDLTLNDVAEIVDCDAEDLDYNALKLTDFDQIVDNAIENEKVYNLAVEVYGVDDFEKLSEIVYDEYMTGYKEGNENLQYVSVEKYIELVKEQCS